MRVDSGNLSQDKKQAIIKAALNEFAEKGYDEASTNAIVQAAGISKGLLFHYFGSKKDLFLYLYDYGLGILKERYLDFLDVTGGDAFEQMKQATLMKLRFIEEFPEIYAFNAMVHAKPSESLKAELGRRDRESMTETINRILDNVDTSEFRAGIDPGKAMDIIRWTLDGYADRVMRNPRALDPSGIEELIEGIEGYYALIRHGICG